MRKIIVGAFTSLDGVMQAPGGPEEDPTGGFRFGGWAAPIFDEKVGAAIGELFSTPFDLLLRPTTSSQPIGPMRQRTIRSVRSSTGSTNMSPRATLPSDRPGRTAMSSASMRSRPSKR